MLGMPPTESRRDRSIRDRRVAPIPVHAVEVAKGGAKVPSRLPRRQDDSTGAHRARSGVTGSSIQKRVAYCIKLPLLN